MRTLITATLVSLLALGACRRSEPAAPPSPPVPAPATPAAPPPATPKAEAHAQPGEGEEVRLAQSGDVTLRGSLLRPKAPDAPVFVLLHQMGSDRSEWRGLRARLAELGDVGFLAMDLRGHGASTVKGEAALSVKDLGPADFQAMQRDVARTLEWLRTASGLTPRAIVLVGSSIGSTAALLHAAEDDTVRAVVAISPGRSYKDLDIVPALERYGSRLLFAVAAKDDTYSAEAVATIARLCPTARTVTGAGSAHGVRLFADNPNVPSDIAGWLRAILGSPAAH